MLHINVIMHHVSRGSIIPSLISHIVCVTCGIWVVGG
jgi:hypothetical protein